MKKILLLLTALVSFGLANSVLGSEGHEKAFFGEFHVDKAHVQLTLHPESYTEGKAPEVVISLTDLATKNPILDAEVYILIEKAGQNSAHEGHTPSSISNSTSAQGEGLDFGDVVPMEMPSSVDLSAYKRLVPQQKAGNYSALYHLHEEGEYIYTLAIRSFGEGQFEKPLLVGGKITYVRASQIPFYRMLFVIGIIFLSGIFGVWILSQRKSASIARGQKLNILDIPWIKRFMKSAWFQPVFQIPAFIFFTIIIFAGLFDVQQGDRNIATLLMWTIWWAAIIFTFVFVGRVWCMMCPFGAVQDWIGRFARLNRSFPKPLRNIWLSSFLFFGLTLWDSYSGIVNKPALTAFLLLGFFAAAVGMAFVFKGRSFCRYVCPIGGLIGIYSMFSPVELRNRCIETCRGHRVKECMKGNAPGRPCPMFETPMTLDRNNYCNFCSECVKSCSQDNIVIRFRSFAKDLWGSARGYMDEAYLALVILGVSIVVTGEMVEPSHRWMDAIGKALPLSLLGITDHAGAEKAIVPIVMTIGSLVVPALLLLAASGIVRKSTGSASPLGLKATFIQFAYMFIPVGLAMHLAHNISHLFKEGPGIIPAIQRVLITYTGLEMAEPDWNVVPLMGNESIFWLQMAILMILNIFSLYAGYRIAVRHYGDKALRAFIPMAVLAVFFMMVNAFILGQPMTLRHTH
ncbi:MAG: 4Fe-4S binding protein [Nitrospirota bacterium]